MERMAFSIDESLRDIYADFDKFLKENELGIKKGIRKAGLDIESKAKQKVTQLTGKMNYKVTGDLSASIMPNYSNTGMAVQVGSQKHYAALVEFGTGTLVSIPAGLEDYAMQFKGAGIKEVNLPARPYLFPAFATVSDWFIGYLEKLYSKKK